MPAILRFDAALADFKGVKRAIEVRADQTLVDLHEGIQEAFGWMNDHLYSFWLDGRFWGERATEYTAPIEPDRDVATADIATEAWSEAGSEDRLCLRFRRQLAGGAAPGRQRRRRGGAVSAGRGG